MNRRQRYGNRLLYFCVLAFFFASAWAYGGAMLYLSLYTLILLPVFSYIVTFFALRGLKVTQRTENDRLIKDEPSRYEIGIHNKTPLVFNGIEFQFIDDHFAVEANREWKMFYARPFIKETLTVDFRVRYRGRYGLGLQTLRVNDMLGIFTLRKKLNETIDILVWPKLPDIPHFPLMSNILSQSDSNFEIREEDYAVVTDVRKYEPTDPLKRVHWKLTAKRNEWMVKNFQTNALNRITIMTDTFKPCDEYEESLILEDKIIETAMAVMNYCLRHGMPVEWQVRTDVKREAHSQENFDAVFRMAAELTFDGTPETSSVLPMLNKGINETAGYINAVLFTVKPNLALHERIISAQRMGHNFSVLYFKPEDSSSDEAEYAFERLKESGIPSYIVTPETDLADLTVFGMG